MMNAPGQGAPAASLRDTKHLDCTASKKRNGARQIVWIKMP